MGLSLEDIGGLPGGQILRSFLSIGHNDDGSVRGSGSTTLSSVLDVGNSAGGHAITNLSDPTNAQDAATKAYVLANGGGGGGVAQYVVASDGSTVTAYSAGVSVSSGTDGGAVLAAILPAASSVGAVVDFRNDGHAFPWGSVPGLPKGITGKLLLRGNGVTVRLSSGGPRFLDLARTADYDTFQNIEVDGFTVDCNSVAANAHVILGSNSGADATQDQRVNHQNITVRNCKAINVPTVSGGRRGITLSCHHLSDNEATQTSTKDILIENVRVEGGCAGFGMNAGSNPFSSSAVTNHFFDRIRIIGCYHDCGSTQASGTYYNVQIGQNGYGGKVTIRDFYGRYSGDVGIEIDNMTEAIHDNVVIENATNHHFYVTNYRAPDKPNSQRWMFLNCKTITSDATHGPGTPWGLAPNNSIALGAVYIIDCAVHRDSGGAITGDVISNSGTITCPRIHIEGLQANLDAGSVSGNYIPIFLSNVTNGSSPTRLVIHRSSLRQRGTWGGSLSPEGIRVIGTSNIYFDIDGFDYDSNITNLAANQTNRMYGINFSNATAATIAGSIRRFRVTLADDPVPWAIRFGTSTTNPIDAGGILVDSCDFSGLLAANREITAGDATTWAKIKLKNIRWFTYPKPSAAMGTSNFASGSFTTATGNQYIGGSDADIHFANGTGAGITKIEASKDGTTYESVWDQASGAMTQDVLVPVEAGDYIRVTFATTQPTTRVRFHR